MSRSKSAPSLITTGIIARHLRVPIHRVARILATRRHIRPLAYAGTMRLYDRAAVAAVRRELDDIAARRRNRRGRR